MSDEPRRHRRRRSTSRPRRRQSKTSRQEDDSWKPDSEFLQGYQYGHRKGSFKDGAERGFDDGYHARRSQKAVNGAKYDTYDPASDREDLEMKRQDIMDDIEKLTQPNEKLTKNNLKQLVDAYRNCEENVSDNDSSAYSEEDTNTDEDTDSDEDEDTDTDEDTEDDEDKSNTDSGNTVASKSISILKGCLRDDDDAEDDDTNDDEITDKYTEENDEWREW